MSTAPKGRTHDCKRPALFTQKTLAIRGPSTHDPKWTLVSARFCLPSVENKGNCFLGLWAGAMTPEHRFGCSRGSSKMKPRAKRQG
jgi:hypothetical protein